MGYWRWNLPFHYTYLIFDGYTSKNEKMYCMSFPRQSRHPLLRSQLKEKTHQRLLSFCLISNKRRPTGKGTQTGGNPCPPVHLVWSGGCILIFTHSLWLTNCPTSCNSCTDSDMSSEMMPKPALVTPWTAGAACVAMIRVIAFISSNSLRVCASNSHFPLYS